MLRLVSKSFPKVCSVCAKKFRENVRATASEISKLHNLENEKVTQRGYIHYVSQQKTSSLANQK